MKQADRIGVITSGSLQEGLTARLDDSYEIERLRVGQFMVVIGQRYRFFSMLTDVQLAATSPAILSDPPGNDHPLLQQILAGRGTYGTFKITPQLMLSNNLAEQELQPVRTIPGHFAPIYEATESDFAMVFGEENERNFHMGEPLDMEVPVCIDLQRFVERSNGVFGKSGTGKSFLTRILLSGVIKHRVATNLIFDMHSEYGWSGTTEDKTTQVKGLAQIFRSRGDVLVYTLDPDASRKRGSQYDVAVSISMDEIEVGDITLLQNTMKLNSTATESAYICVTKFGNQWIRQLLAMDSETLKEFADSSGANLASIAALRRKLTRFEQLSYITKNANHNAINQLVETLMSGKSIVLEFGQHRDELSYMLVSNIITRRIYSRWVDQTDIFLASKRAGDKPPQLMITIEEAHKFLHSGVANETIFGTIARELRKYSVTLLVVDQRPSSIDNEVMSQLGSRVTALLNDDKDIDAVFTGVSGSRGLKSVLSSLDSRQQAMILGHAVPMPVVIRTRSYDQDFYEAMQSSNRNNNGPRQPGARYQSAQEEADELFS